MGITIHYSGNFNPAASLLELIVEIKDIAEIYKWKYQIYDTDFPASGNDDRVYGIKFMPPECEPVSLTFLANGKMVNAFMYGFWLKSKSAQDKKYMFGNFTKTQYAGAQIHVVLIHLLKYISKKYLKNFKVIDEGEYWKTEDEKLLQEKFNQNKLLIENFKSSLDNFPIRAGEKIEPYLERLFSYIQMKNKG